MTCTPATACRSAARTNGIWCAALVAQYRALPEEQRRELPALLNGLGKMHVIDGNFDAARSDFSEVAALANEPAAQAEAHHNAYRAALEQRNWSRRRCWNCGGRSSWMPPASPPSRWTSTSRSASSARAASGWLSCAGIGSWTLWWSSSRCGRTTWTATWTKVFSEARLLRQVEHPAIIRLWDCEYAGPAGKSRPYLVMDYFEGLTLEEHVQRHGPLTQPADVLAVPGGAARGLQRRMRGACCTAT